jgi:hypothetical protein
MLQRLQQKMRPSTSENIVSSLVESVLDDGSGFSFRLDAVHDQTAVLDAILPDPKFTKYLFVHREKDDKSNWLMNELGVQPDDWRFLAAQLYSGLLRQSRFDVEVVEYGEGEPRDYRGKFNQTLELVARDMKVMPATIVWQMKKGELPSLVTIKPGAKGKTPLDYHYPAEVFPPDCLSGHKHMEDLLRGADSEGGQSAEAAVPTPIVAEGEWYSSGMGGWSRIQVHDAMLAECAKVTEAEADFGLSNGGQLGFRHSSGSLEKAMEYAKTFCRVLGWNGFKASFDLQPD